LYFVLKNFKHMRGQAFVFFLIIALIPIVLPLEAQFSLGVNAGVTRIKFSGDRQTGFGYFKPGLGLSAALRLDYRFSNAVAISFQPGITNLRTGFEVGNVRGPGLYDSTQLAMNSISLPLHAVVWSRNGRFFVLAGLQLDYTHGKKGRALISPYAYSPEVRDYNLYMQFGAGFIVPLGKPYLSFDLRYSQGLLDLNSPLIHSATVTALPRTRLTNLLFIIGLQVPLGTYSEKYQVKQKPR
jgi:hypothetical protein